MTPSVELLQHEYEAHGTCMHNPKLRTPEGYFDSALKIHQRLTLPEHEMSNPGRGIEWLTEHNPGLPAKAIYFSKSAREWRICVSNSFEWDGLPSK